ncbi:MULTISPECIES: hypothetical protein [unclassified Streptomyces]|uniref:hypothetical protein n=1 Tax=unclassified Streptomyces TaxID=2593676 RepID=UPI000BF0F281|nr:MULTISPECIES: hypothetical protein [unclassified Streptomyces]
MSHALTTRHRRLAAAAAVDKAVLYTTISAGMVLARRYLTGRGVDQAFADQYGSPFGRTAAKVYRTEMGTEPRKAWSNVHGKWRRVNGFLPSETAVLDKAFVTYKRTAEYIAPAPVAAPAETEPRTDELTVGDKVRHPHDWTLITVSSVETLDSVGSPLDFHNRKTDEMERGLRVTGTDADGETVHVDCAPSYLWHRETLAPAEVYVNATAGYAARFEGLTGDSLRALETLHGSEAPTDHINPLLGTLADWKQHLDRFEAAVTDADEKAVEGLPEGDPRRITWRAASTGMDAFLKAQVAVHGAYVDWSFDLTASVEIDWAPPAAPVVSEGCRIPGCDQHWHYDGLYVAQLGELPFDEGSSLPIELTSPEDEPPYIVAYAFDPVAMNMRRQMNTQADAVAFAKALRDAADAVDEAAAHLAA